MNQDKIIVELKKENDDDVLEFEFKNKVNINFIKSENNDIKEVFKKILEELTKNVFYLELKISEENIRRRILANDFIPEEKIYPYRISKTNYFGTKSIFKKKYKPKGIIALYYYYKHLLGYCKKIMYHTN